MFEQSIIYIQTTSFPCSCLAQGLLQVPEDVASDKTDPNSYLHGTYILMGKTDNKLDRDVGLC